jgi:selenium-binding protein 1
MKIKLISTALAALVLGACGGYEGENHLYLNLAAEGGGNDAALVIDVNQDSANYGKIIKHIDFGSKGNEPHHTGISPDRKTVYYMGLFPPGRIWKTDITVPESPTLGAVVNDAAADVGANDPDEFVGLPDGRFLVSFMGSAAATAPGAIGLFNADGTKSALFENTSDQAMAFNPHGFDVRTDIGRMANGNFIMPADAAGLDGTPLGDSFRAGLVVWDLNLDAKTANVIHTYDLSMGRPAAMSSGIMDVKMLKGDAKGRVFATNMLAGEVWLASTVEPFEASAVITGLQTPQLMQLTKDGKTLFVSTYADDKIHKYDVTDPAHPVSLGDVQGPEPMVGSPTGAHYLKMSTDETRIYCTSYFVNLKDDTAGVMGNDAANTVEFAGTRHLWAVDTEKMTKLEGFDIDFSSTSFTLADGTAISGGPFGPHGVELDQ